MPHENPRALHTRLAFAHSNFLFPRIGVSADITTCGGGGINPILQCDDAI